MFPGISFAVVDNLGGLVSSYNNFENEDCFGQLGVPSITLSEEILEKLHDSEEGNTVMIHGRAQNAQYISNYSINSGSLVSPTTQSNISSAHLPFMHKHPSVKL